MPLNKNMKYAVICWVFAALPIGTIAQPLGPTQATSSACSSDRISGSMSVQQALSHFRPIPPKGEFETTTAFEARVRTQAWADFNSRSRDILNVALLIQIELFVRYDADRRELIVGDEYQSLFFVNTTSPRPNLDVFRYVSIQSSRRDTGSFVGTNAYGTSIKVHRVTENVTGLIPEVGSSLGASWPEITNRPIRLGMSPEEAEPTKANLALLVVGPLVAPFVRNGASSISATTQLPVEREIEVRSLVVRPHCVALVNRHTGVVLRQL